MNWSPRDDVLEDHGQHVPGSLDWYSGWAGPLGAEVFAAADRLSSLSSRLLIPNVRGKAESTVRAGADVGAEVARPPSPLCVVCDDAGCSHCPGVAA